jgi:hypothetical protein
MAESLDNDDAVLLTDLTLGTLPPIGSDNEEHPDQPLGLPLELITDIFLIASACRHTAHALSVVSTWAWAISAPALFETVHLKSVAELCLMLGCLKSRIRLPHILMSIKNLAIWPTAARRKTGLMLLAFQDPDTETVSYDRLIELLLKMSRLERIWVQPSTFLILQEYWDKSFPLHISGPPPQLGFLPQYPAADVFPATLPRTILEHALRRRSGAGITHLDLSSPLFGDIFRMDSVWEAFPCLTRIAWRDSFDAEWIDHRIDVARRRGGIFRPSGQYVAPIMKMMVFALFIEGEVDREETREMFEKVIRSQADGSWIRPTQRFVVLIEGKGHMNKMTVNGMDLWERAELEKGAWERELTSNHE